MIEYSDKFSSLYNEKHSSVYQIFPKVFCDGRGSFSEVLKTDNENDLSWIKQINRSKSTRLTVRGCHAQRGNFCQAKLVEAINEPIYDVITDMRPESITFGHTAAYLLDPVAQNKLFVPHGFLHAFVVPNDIKSDEAIFQYYCDNVYDKDSEFGVNPLTIIPDFVNTLRQNQSDDESCCLMQSLFSAFDNIDAISISDKDKNNISFDEFKNKVQDEYVYHGISWWKGQYV